MPDYVLECAAGGRVAGVDEAGRGPWAGPVVAAAVILAPGCLPEALARAIDDSKRLAKPARERLFGPILEATSVGVGAASVEEIDRLNILQATMLAMTRAIDRLPVRPDMVLVDGNRAPSLPCPVQCVVGGDGKSLSIAAASIVAKVTRDRLMTLLARRYPGYGWDRNAGYGTREHRVALSTLGITPHHRGSFQPIAELLLGQITASSSVTSKTQSSTPTTP